MDDIFNHKTIIADTAAVADAPAMVSLTDWAATTDQDDASLSLTVLKLSAEPAYVSLFTDQGADVTTHYLERTETWTGGYVFCLGTGCPACAAQIDRKRFVLLPVADLTDARVKILRVPSEKGPGKLLVEFPYAEANARMEWDGVPVSRERLTQLHDGLSRAVDLHQAALNDAGLSNPNSSQ